MIAFNEVLTQLGSNEFKQKTKMTNDGIVAQNGMLRLLQVMHTHNDQACQQKNPQQTGLSHHQLQSRDDPKRHRAKKSDVTQWHFLI